MAAFGIGAATPLVLLGLASASAMRNIRGSMRYVGSIGKKLLRVILLVVGLAIVAGVDRMLETRLTDLSPDWLIQLTTRF